MWTDFADAITEKLYLFYKSNMYKIKFYDRCGNGTLEDGCDYKNNFFVGRLLSSVWHPLPHQLL